MDVDLSVLREFAELYRDRYRYQLYWSGRSTGKTYAVAQSQLVRAMSQRLLFLNAREYMSTIADSVKAELENQIRANGWQRQFTVTRDRVMCNVTGSTWIFAGLKSDPSKVLSMSGIDECWVEEAQSVSDESLRLLLPTIRKPGSRVIFTMNRARIDDPVFKFFRETPPPRSLVKYLDEYTLDRYGLQPVAMRDLRESQKDSPLYAHIWQGQPLSQLDSAVLDRDALARALEREGDDTGAWRLGVDVARFGADRTAIAVVKGESLKALAVYEKIAINQQAATIGGMMANLGTPKEVRIKVDDTGVGGGLTDLLKDKGYCVEPVNFAQGARESDRYPGAASEMWFDFAERLGTVGLKGAGHHGVELLEELSQRQWSYDAKGRRKIESKDDYKRKGNRSPDLADALLLAFYEPKRKKTQNWWGF